MDGGFGALSTITLMGAAQGVFLALALLNTGTGDLRAHRILALLTLLFSIDLGEEFLYQVGFFASAPHLLNLLAPIDLLYGPLIYLYVLQLTSPLDGGFFRRHAWHFVPLLVGFLLLVPFFLMAGPDKLEFTESLRTGAAMADGGAGVTPVQAGLLVFMLGTILQIGVYLWLSIRKLIAHSKHIRDEFSDIEKINLAWLRNLLLGLGCIFLLYLGDQLFPDLMGMNILGDLITVVAVVLIYAMGYLGLRQPAIFARTLAVAPTGTTEVKYRRSGLDESTSRAFLDELTRHMRTGKPYLDGDLVSPQLAGQLGISANYLSQIINEQLQMNFHDFVNGYRVEEAKRLIRESAQDRPNILEIALESGFNSKSAFYTAFRKATSMTPTQYREAMPSPDL